MTPAEYEARIAKLERECQRYRNTLTTIREYLPNGSTASRHIDSALAAPSTLGVPLLEVE